MGEELIFNGRKYVPASIAASSAGYTNDYVARLCREKKVEGRMVGKTWHVEEDSFFRFVFEANRQREKRKKELSESRKKEYDVVAREGQRDTLREHHPAASPLRSRLKKAIIFRRGREAALALALLLIVGLAPLGMALKETANPAVSHSVLASAAYLLHDNPRLVPLAPIARMEAAALESAFSFLADAHVLGSTVLEEGKAGALFVFGRFEHEMRKSVLFLRSSLAAVMNAIAATRTPTP